MIGANGNVLLVKITVIETTGPKEPNPIYSVEAMKIEHPPSVLSRGNPDKTGISPQAGLSESVLDLVRGVKAALKVVDADDARITFQRRTAAEIRFDALQGRMFTLAKLQAMGFRAGAQGWNYRANDWVSIRARFLGRAMLSKRVIASPADKFQSAPGF
ncbi:MAG: hypothetical protein IT475_11995 [Aquimonas sp.]|nr:hypothetical protein [Aquimonas sp.]